MDWDVASHRHASHGSCGLIPSLETRRVSGANDFSDQHLLRTWNGKYPHSLEKYTVVDTVTTFPGAKTICVDTATHNVYLFQPERGPAPETPAGAPPAAAGGRGRGPQGPVIAAWFIAIKQ